MMKHMYPNQGHQIALNWDAQASLRNWTAYFGTDNVQFLPPNDRNGYTDGVERRLNTGGVRASGFPIVRLTFPHMTYGQVDYVDATFKDQNVTVAIHKPNSTSKTDTFVYNAVCNFDMNQFQNLKRESNGYTDVVIELVLVEPIS